MNPNDLKQFAPFRDLSAEELDLLLPLLEERTLAKGRRVMSEGEDAEGLLLLAQGSVRVATEQGHEGEIAAPAVFGTAALVSVGTRAMTAVALEPSSVHVLTRTAFHRFADDAPRAAVRLLESIVADFATLLRQGTDLA